MSTQWVGRRGRTLAAALLLVGCSQGAASLHAARGQTVVVESAPPAAAAQPASDAKPAGAAESSPAGEKKPDAKPADAKVGEPKPGETKPGESKPGESKPGESKPAEPPVTPRPPKPEVEPDPAELNVRPNGEGKVRVNFHGQPWPAVLQWLADISHMSLDWQELPGDYLNLSTQRPYTVDELRDLVNRHLLARGFTMLRQGEMLAVVNVKKLDPGLVPRVAPAELAERAPYDFVKVSFALDWLLAETAAEELKPMLSPNGKLTALKSTNRLEAIDAAANLREIHALLQQEQSSAGQERLVREFVLKHARASEVEKQLQTLLGLEDKSKKERPISPDEMRMLQEQMAMQQARGGQPPPQPDKPKGPAVNLVVNRRKNAVVASAPPDKMALIEQAVKVLDVPAVGAEQFLANLNKMQVYRLAGLDPEPLVTTLNELGVLDPGTRLEVDKKNRSIIAYASLADHVMIRSMVTKLDSSGRRFEVIALKKLEADYVAGTIEFMIGGGDKQQQSSRRPYYFDYGWGYGSRREQDEAAADKFRVDADTENNRLLVWANQVELDEVLNLLGKLGEIPARGAGAGTVRVLQVGPGQEGEAALERMRRAWPRFSRSPLLAPDAPPPTPAPRRPSAPSDDSRQPAPPPDPSSPAPAGPAQAETSAARSPAARLASLQAPREEAAPGERSQPAAPPATPEPPPGAPQPDAPDPPPINVVPGPNGQWLVTSSDTKALDLFEELFAQFAPKRRDYEVFYLKHASPTWVSLKLDDYFATDDKKKNDRSDRFRYWYFDEPPQQQQKSDVRRLSRRRPLKFISDVDTSTILVQGADPAQLRLIGELIEIYDQPEPLKSSAARVTSHFTLRHSQARVVADAVKDVFRDLLSANDRALLNADQQKNRRPESAMTYITNIGGESEGDERRTQVSFKGKLSLGVDELSNTIIVSTEGATLMSNVAKLIETLDQAAEPSLATVRVVRLGGQMDSGDVRQAISRILAQQQRAAGARRPEQGNAPHGGAAPGAGNGGAAGGDTPGSSQQTPGP